MNIEALARPDIVAMKPYSSARKEAPGQGILLNANEAPRPLLTEPDAGAGLNRYPDPQPQQLVSKLARLYRLPESRLLVTRGSDEGIDLLIMGAFGHSPLRSLFFGSKTADLLRSSGIPTLLLR